MGKLFLREVTDAKQDGKFEWVLMLMNLSRFLLEFMFDCSGLITTKQIMWCMFSINVLINK